jgi:hypothetical protein
MLTRRNFLHRFLRLGIAGTSIPIAASAPLCDNLRPSDPALAEYESILAASQRLELLGRPLSWSLVRAGFHPISPERVIIITEKGRDGWLGRDQAREGRLLERSQVQQLELSASKCRIALRLIHVLTDFYGATHLYESWAMRLMRREALGSTGVGSGFSLLHQFQDCSAIRLANAPVDWWLFLFPDGVDWGAFDAQPVYAMLSHVFPPRALPGLAIRVYHLTSLVTWELRGDQKNTTASQRLARLDRSAAAREVNGAIARCLRWA